MHLLVAAEFASVDWAALVIDVAQFVKNPQTKLHRAARDLRAPMTFAITGTPLENSLTELWALLSLTAPGLFPSARRFRELHAVPDDREIAVLEPIERLPRALQMLELEAEPVSH